MYCAVICVVLCCYLCCSVIMVLFYVLIVCTVTLPPGVNPIAVDKYIYIYDLFHRDSWKYMLGYKIVPTTNLQQYHFGIHVSKCKTHQYFSSEK